MKIIIAKTAGFCMGVRRAVELVLEASKTQKTPIYTYGPLIHNSQVLNLLEEKGIRVLDQIPQKGEGTVLVRAHGVPPEAKKQLIDAGFNVIDATCPRVIKVQNIILTHARKNYASIILGDRDHPEVVGLLGYAMDKGYVVNSLQEIEHLPKFEKAIIVAQTTQNTQFIKEIKNWAQLNAPDYKFFNTVCDSTERRQKEVKEMAQMVDAIVVVGGKNSGNTRRLYDIAKESDKIALHIESEEELDPEKLKTSKTIGITAGASTPNWIIKRVYRSIESLSINGRKGFSKRLFKIQRFLLLSNIYVALGAGFLCHAAINLQGGKVLFPHMLMAFLYVLSMHILNNLTGIKADRYNDPDRASFYQKRMWYLAILALISGACGLMIATTSGMLPFLLLLGMSITGLMYNLPLLPNNFKAIKYKSIRDLPGSKTILITLAWGIVTTILPSLSVTGKFNGITLLIFVWASGMVFARTAFFDILDMQGDRIVGKETLPIFLGEKKTMGLLRALLLFLFAMLVVSSLLGEIEKLGFGIAVLCLSMYGIVYVYQKKQLLPGFRLEFLIESHFVMIGLLSLVWSLL